LFFFSTRPHSQKLTSQAVADDLRCASHQPITTQRNRHEQSSRNQDFGLRRFCFAARRARVQAQTKSRRPMPQCKADLAVEAFGRGPQPIPGPPAFVPPQVVRPRPSVAEVAKMNADLQQFIAASPDKGLFQKYEPDLGVQMPRENRPSVRSAAACAGPRHQKFVDIASTNEFDILF